MPATNSSFHTANKSTTIESAMKSPLNTRRIMHGLGASARAAAIASLGMTSGCMALRAGKNTYAITSPAVHLHEAEVRLQVKPEGTEGGSFAFSAMVVGAAVATFDGPFRWRIEATGREGFHRSLAVHRIRTRTSITGRDEWYPAKHLGHREEFRPTPGSSGSARAVYPVPGLLMVKPAQDGTLTIDVDLSIAGGGTTRREWLRFRLEPAHKRQDEFVFLPAEIVSHIGKPIEDWEESGWD